MLFICEEYEAEKHNAGDSGQSGGVDQFAPVLFASHTFLCYRIDAFYFKEIVQGNFSVVFQTFRRYQIGDYKEDIGDRGREKGCFLFMPQNCSEQEHACGQKIRLDSRQR